MDNNDGTPERLVIRNLQVTDDFFEVMGIQMASGRDFSKRLLTDIGTAFIVNETMVKNRGWKDPLGKKIQMNQLSGRVVGVVKDFHFRSLHNAMEPLIINQLGEGGNQRVLILKISDKEVPQTLSFLQKKFAEYDPRHSFDFAFLDDSIDRLYMSEKRLMKMTGMFSGICIFISCLGLFGLASYYHGAAQEGNRHSQSPGRFGIANHCDARSQDPMACPGRIRSRIHHRLFCDRRMAIGVSPTVWGSIRWSL